MLRKSITKTIGKEKHVFQFEASDFFEVVMNSQDLSFPDVHKCGLCGSDNLTLGAHIAKEKHKYVHITCKDCRGSLNFGKQQGNPNIFYLRTKKDNAGNSVKDEKGFLVYDWREFSKED